MRCIIAGTRTIQDYKLVTKAITDSGWQSEITEVVCGGAKGVDTLGQTWAIENGIKVIMFFPNWREYGQRAGPMRNEEMAKYADAAIVIWDGRSRGSQSMLNLAKRHNLRIYEHVVSD